jgi:hypothetical protein
MVVIQVDVDSLWVEKGWKILDEMYIIMQYVENRGDYNEEWGRNNDGEVRERMIEDVMRTINNVMKSCRI